MTVNKMVSGALLTSAGRYIVKLIYKCNSLESGCFKICLGGVLSLLDEIEEEIQVFALSRLDELVDVFWAEIAESITKM